MQLFSKNIHQTRKVNQGRKVSKIKFHKYYHYDSHPSVYSLTLWPLYAYIYAQSEKAFNSQCKHSTVLRHVFFKKWKMTAASERKSIVSIDWCGIWLPSLFQPNFMGVGASDPIYTLPYPQGSRKHISLKYHIELAVPPWKHKIMKSVGGLLGPRVVRVSGTAETEYASGKPAVWPLVLSDLSIGSYVCSS